MDDDVAEAGAGLPVPPEGASPDAAMPSPPPRRRRWIVAAAAATLLLVACGAYASYRLAGSGDSLLTTVPAGADVVVTAYLDPDASQKTNLLRIMGEFPDLGDRAAMEETINAWLDDGLADIGLSHADLGWVGSQVLVWADIEDLEHPAVALAVDVDDPDAAEAALDRVRAALGDDGDEPSVETYEGVDIVAAPDGSWALDGHVLLVTTDGDVARDALDAIAGRAPSIDEEPSFAAATGELPTEVLGLLYVDAEGLMDVLPPGALATTPGGGGTYQQLAMTLSVEPDGLVVDATTVTDTSGMDPELVARLDTVEPNGALASIPSGSLVAFATGDVDVNVDAAIDGIEGQAPRFAEELAASGITGPGGLLDALRGDLAFGAWSAAGDPGVQIPFGGVLVVGADDPAALESSLGDLFADLPGSSRYSCNSDGDCEVHERPLRWQTLDHDGVAVHVATGGDLPLAWAVADDLAIIGLSPEDVAAAIATARGGPGLTGDDRYVGAVAQVGADPGQVAYVDVTGIVDAVRTALGPDAAEFDADAAPYLEPIDLIVAGSSGDAAIQHMRVLVRIP